MQCFVCSYEFQFKDLANMTLAIAAGRRASDVYYDAGVAGMEFIENLWQALKEPTLYWKDLSPCSHCPACAHEFLYQELIYIVEAILDTRYPPDIFTGKSDDLGARFIARLREAFEELPAQWHEEINTGCKSSQEDLCR